MLSISSKTIIILLALISVKESEATARLIRVPLQRATTQSVGTYGQPVVNYITQIEIGTPPIPFKVQFDLGSADHFVPHYSWNPFNRNLHYSNGFQCKSSSTCIKDDQTVNIIYQNCQLTGKRYEDFISLVNVHGNATTTLNNSTQVSGNNNIKWRQNFLAISSASDDRFSSLPIDGFFGLAPSPKSLALLDNILIDLHKSNEIENLQFSIWFNPVLDVPQGGELILGGVDPTRYQGQIYWHHLSNLNFNYWMLNLQFVTLGNQHVSCYGANCTVRFSSGVSDLYGPPEEVKRIYSLLNSTHQSTGLELIDCRSIIHLPLLTFNIDGIPYSLLPSNYIRKTVDGRVFKRETCYLSILPGDNKNEWILGTNFLGAYYSIYDVTYRQIGFAALK